MVSQIELNKALDLMNLSWTKQDDTRDFATEFIYTAQSVDELLFECNKKGIKDTSYVLHRWYNYQTSKNCEELFSKHGAVKEKNETHKEIDFYINGVPFDLKLSVYPAALKDKPFDIKNHKDKDFLVQWFFSNQSNATRRHFANRLFIVCDGNSVLENMQLKANSDLIEKAIIEYMREHKYYPHLVRIKTDTGYKNVFSDVILIKKE